MLTSSDGQIRPHHQSACLSTAGWKWMLLENRPRIKGDHANPCRKTICGNRWPSRREVTANHSSTTRLLMLHSILSVCISVASCTEFVYNICTSCALISQEWCVQPNRHQICHLSAESAFFSSKYKWITWSSTYSIYVDYYYFPSVHDGNLYLAALLPGERFKCGSGSIWWIMTTVQIWTVVNPPRKTEEQPRLSLKTQVTNAFKINQ